MAKGTYKIPFDQQGNQLDYPEHSYLRGVMTPCKMEENYEFSDTLTFQDYGRGRSSVTFTMKRANTGKTVTMFVSDFANIINKMNHGHVTGRFTFVKKGQNYGCKMVAP